MAGTANGWSRRALLDAAFAGVVVPLGSEPARAAGGLLQARGSKFFYDGRPVRLRGVAVGDPLLGRRDRPVDDFRILARTWRCNVVRISVHPAAWRDSRVAALGALERDVAAALANRMWVVVDWHAIGWPDGYSPDPLYDTDWNLAISFWSAVVRRFGADGRIAFELWNEPRFDLDAFGAPPTGHWPMLKMRYRELLAIVRGRSRNLVLLGGDRWTHDLRGIASDPAEGANLAYTWHVYAGQDDNDPVRWAKQLDNLDQAHPVLVTEWGFCRTCEGDHFQGTPEGFGRPFMRTFLNGRAMSWIAWIWHPDWRPSLIEADWRTPTEFGRFVMAHLGQGSQQRP
jgi:endoglucanase